MKKTFISLSIAAILFAGCNSNQSKEHKEQEGIHVHEDGSLHEHHQDTTLQQEEFTVSSDTAVLIDKPHSHSHDSGGTHEHPHQH